MYCKYCGKKLGDNETCTCPGARAEAGQTEEAGSSFEPSAGAGETGAVPRALLAKLGGGILAALLVLILVAVAVVNKTNTLDLKDYVQVTFSGMDTKGSAQVAVDWSALEDAMADAGRGDRLDAIDLETSVEVNADPTEELTNGDTVTVQLSYDETMADKMKLKLVNTTLTFSVSGLEEGKAADAFADLAISYEGIAPHGTAVVTNNSQDSFVKTISYSVEPSSDLSNGDTVTVTALYNEYNAEDQRRYLPETTKTYTVEGLDEYVQSYDQLDEDTIAAVTQQSRDVMDTKLLADTTNYCSSAYGKYMHEVYNNTEQTVLQEVTLLNSYFAATKAEDNTRYGNQLIQVFQVNATDAASPDGVTFYFAVKYVNFLKEADGTIRVDLTDNESYGNTSTDGIYNEMVAPLTATYTVTQS